MTNVVKYVGERIARTVQAINIRCGDFTCVLTRTKRVVFRLIRDLRTRAGCKIRWIRRRKFSTRPKERAARMSRRSLIVTNI